MHGNRVPDMCTGFQDMLTSDLDMLTGPIYMGNIQDHAKGLAGYTRQCKSISRHGHRLQDVLKGSQDMLTVSQDMLTGLKHTLLMLCRHGVNIFSVSLNTAKVFHIILIG
jgi:hypothetical protein